MPSSKNSTIGESLLDEAGNLQTFQRLVASPCFHEKENERSDVVIVENNKMCDAIDVSKARRILVRFAKTLAFLRLYMKASSKFLAQNFLKPSSVQEMRNDGCQDAKNFGFVQYFGVLSGAKQKKDKIDKIHEFLCLKWHRKSGGPGNISAGMECRLVLIKAIRGTVNLISRNTVL